MGPRRARASARSRPGASRTSKLAARMSTSTTPTSQTNNITSCRSSEDNHKGTVESFLLSCPSLSVTRADMMELCWTSLNRFPKLFSLAITCFTMDPVEALLDCSTMSPVIKVKQIDGEDVLYSRNVCQAIHNARVSLLST